MEPSLEGLIPKVALLLYPVLVNGQLFKRTRMIGRRRYFFSLCGFYVWCLFRAEEWQKTTTTTTSTTRRVVWDAYKQLDELRLRDCEDEQKAFEVP